MAIVKTVGNVTTAHEEIENIIQFNKDRKKGQYNYVYKERLKDGSYIIGLTKEEPKGKTKTFRELHPKQYSLFVNGKELLTTRGYSLRYLKVVKKNNEEVSRLKDMNDKFEIKKV